MNLDDIRSLVAVAEMGSLARAAQRLNVTQPAVTRRIQRLEADLGVQLLDRDLKPARLTRAGEDAYRHALRLLEAGRALRAGLGEAPVRIGVSYAVADTVLALAVQAVQEAAPGGRLALQAGVSERLVKAVAGRTLDGAVVCATRKQPLMGDFDLRPLGRERVVVVAPLSHPAPERTTLAGIARERWVISPDGCGFRDQLDLALEGEGAALDVIVEVRGAQMQLPLVAAGAGLGLAPERIIRAHSHLPLRVLDVTDFQAELCVFLASPTDPGPAAAALDALAQAVAAEMG